MTNSSDNGSIPLSAKPDNSAVVVPAVTIEVDGATRRFGWPNLAEELVSGRSPSRHLGINDVWTVRAGGNAIGIRSLTPP